MIPIYPEKNKFKIIYIDLVHACNMECNNCYLPNRDFPDTDVEKLKNFIDSFTTKTSFRLIGGEPTLHKNILEIVKHISTHQLNHNLILVTNGLKLASKQFTKSLKKNGLVGVYISMNGFDEDSIYIKLDNMPCAKLKMKALENVLNENMYVAVGCIIVKNVNEHVIDRMIEYFSTIKKIIHFEFRNIGDVGRNMVDSEKSENYSYSELLTLIRKKFQLSEKHLIEDDVYSQFYSKKNFRIRVNDWETLPSGFNNKTNEIRGRMTEDFKVAPFLEHIIENEGKY